MFKADRYKTRRDKLLNIMGSDTALILGQRLVPRNYAANTFPCRQSSHFLYLAGHNLPDMALLLQDGEFTLFGPQPSMDDIVWTGPLPTLAELGAQVGLNKVRPIEDLPEVLRKNRNNLHYLPPYQGEQLLWLSAMLGENPEKVAQGFSKKLAKALVDLRGVKDEDELKEMEEAHKISALAYNEMALAIKPGKHEWEILATLNERMAKHNAEHSFSPIISIHGEVMHNTTYNNRLAAEKLLLIDSGAESKECYASDITRTFPVGGKFTTRQKEIYDIVHKAQSKAISTVAIGVENLAVHLAASLEIARGLTELGLMKGDPQEAVQVGAHALFLPHGIGHMLGLDVHDMEDLGDLVGYPENEPRSTQFGLNCLRLKRALAAGWTLTIEPGIYFIPELIKMWQAEKRHEAFINYDKLADYLDFGGIRLEDDILVTPSGAKIIGGQMPIASQDVETWMAGRIKA